MAPVEHATFKPVRNLVTIVLWRERDGTLLRPKQAEARYGRALYRGAGPRPQVGSGVLVLRAQDGLPITKDGTDRLNRYGAILRREQPRGRHDAAIVGKPRLAPA
jgi:hypothetical protein